jgi:hypothetical protein
VVLAMEPESMLSFSWNAPPSLPSVRHQRTHVTIRLDAAGERLTRVSLHHDGWGSSGEWDDAFAYFHRAWTQIVLPRLAYRFLHGPLDWENPPGPAALKEGLP